ncbi:hypothetical protein [Prevotella sp.]|uniref:hypothetical protein n=1 Tax=Prevotella sp. TaxID=59823 RepID=UPI002E790AB6|nr:hypothetical protein [Prevotella sp.]MEE0671207.1 hypothetical protein [Prevotella sp.]
MEKKKYQKPLINVVAIDAVEIMAGSPGSSGSKETIPIGNPGSGEQPEPDENGWIWGE